ncbi:unnamed protein product [Soboliphyme baturini]|uniref:DUF3402 domain-containing protein n=1 Tax=Soboliphyme baturini TaxID=241478 RepID=A0A183IH95_9BILA|nr:unnamed protein product [Soboliphyme baturini]
MSLLSKNRSPSIGSSHQRQPLNGFCASNLSAVALCFCFVLLRYSPLWFHYRKKVATVNIDLIKLPLSRGWRRETTVRNISATGVRGEVMYYGPCGKRMCSYAEIIKVSCDLLFWNDLIVILKIMLNLTIVQFRTDAVFPIKEKLIWLSYKVARLAYMNKVRQLRQPVEDLEVDDVKSLPRLKRIKNLRLSGRAFADLLMVVEFINTFGSVLKVDKSEIPSIDALHAALLNDSEHEESLRSLTKILLTLVLEYPSLSNGCQTKMFTGQALRDICVNNSNMSELIRLFLYARDENGQKFGRLLDDHEFDTLSGEDKISILAYMTNELLYCRNVVREIENNIEVVAKLKGDKWSYESRIRAYDLFVLLSFALNLNLLMEIYLLVLFSLRHAHARKTEHPQDETSTSTEIANVEAPKKPSDDNETETEAKWSQDNSDCKINYKCHIPFFQEAGEVRREISRTILKIRSLPCGQDRFLRYYWVLPNTGGVLVESVESSAPGNPACSLTSLHYLQSLQSCEVADCREFYDDDPPFDDLAKGWWILKNGEELDKVHQALTPRGIRERLFNRSFAKHGDLFKENAFGDAKRMLNLHPPPVRIFYMKKSCAVLKPLSLCFLSRLLIAVIDKSNSSTSSANNAQNSASDVPTALATWRAGVSNATSASQLSMCIDSLDSRIAWEKSAMKASCQICRSGENESQLLLCDGCDMGYHMYCFKPQMENVPDTDWYCPVCISDSLRPMIRCSMCRREYHIHCLSTNVPKSPKKDWICQGCENVLPNCRELISLNSHRDSWPFKSPVDTKLFPLYKKVIKKPMDLSTIRSKLLNHKYSKNEDFLKDVHLIFDNCSTFNEDSSPVGIAGYYLREFFKNRWSDLDSRPFKELRR